MFVHLAAALALFRPHYQRIVRGDERSDHCDHDVTADVDTLVLSELFITVSTVTSSNIRVGHRLTS